MASTDKIASPASAAQAEARLLDVRGLNCPLPVLKARKQLKAMRPGERLRVLATDPRAPADFAELCEATGWALLDQKENGGEFEFTLERR